MKQYIGKKVKLEIQVNNQNLFYTAIVLDVSETHLTFKDKFNEIYSYPITSILQINTLNGGSQ